MKMQLLLNLPSKDLINTVADIIRLFFPEAQLVLNGQSDGELVISLAPGTIRGTLGLRETVPITTEIAAECSSFAHPEFRRKLRLLTYRLFSSLLNKKTPWGILTGIRPTKIVHRLLDAGLDAARIVDTLVDNYDLARDKASLLLQVAGIQRPFLAAPAHGSKKIGIYISIPFCPSRCTYCSFPSFPLLKYAGLVEAYLETLAAEIRAVTAVLNTKNLVETVYIGGGTPTCLSKKQLELLLQVVNKYVRTASTIEFTVEAGRPETLCKEKVDLLSAHGVDRVSVNPQTMNQHTLDLIGRDHTIQDIYRAVNLIRNSSIKALNMDLILSLPGEDLNECENTLRQIALLDPENLTIHTLALKKTSSLNLQSNALLPREETVEKMLELANGAAQLTMGLEPYYLYRQKKMLANLENIGYTKKGSACVYNIQIIEERQTILGFGVGAGSKYVQASDFCLTADYNPKDLTAYLQRGQEFSKRKIDKLAEIQYNSL